MILVYVAAAFIAALVSISHIWNVLTSKYSFMYCPFNVPLFGSTLQLENKPEKLKEQIERLTIKGKHLLLLWLSFRPMILGSTIEYSKAILSSQRLLRKSFVYTFLHEWLGTGLLTSHGKKWKTRRRIITPSFHFSILNHFAELFEKHALNLIERMSASTDTKEAIDIQKLVSATTLEAICETSMGVVVNGETSGANYIKAVDSLNHQIQRRQQTIYLWPDFIYRWTSYGKAYYKSLNFLHEYTTSIINKRIAVRIESDSAVSDGDGELSMSKKNICFLDTLLDSYQTGEIDIDGIREEVDTFVFEGYDTTASAISFCLYLMATHPEHQQTLQDEIDNINGKDVLEKMRNMEFLDLCLKETLRLYPPVAFVGRTLEEDTIIDGHTIYKNTELFVNIMMLHRNNSYWKEATKFDPYRFTQENMNERHPFCYVPFSAGPRNCIGQRFALLEAKIYLFFVLKNFSLKSVQKEEDMKLCVEGVMKSKNGIMIEFTKRS